jgi:hypothetical protein
MGIVLSKQPAGDFEEVIPTAGYHSSGQGEHKFLFRLATADKRTSLAMKVLDKERTWEVRPVQKNYPIIKLTIDSDIA